VKTPTNIIYVIFEAHQEENMKFTVFLDVPQCILVERYYRFGETCCLPEVRGSNFLRKKKNV
jgi:hypothetical protein